MSRSKPTDEFRFWSKVSKNPEGCWTWMTGKDKDGYGVFKARGVQVRAHRFSWELEYGPPSPELCVCHHCDNPSCVRPAHLFLATNKENIADKVRKGRQSRGKSHSLAKLPTASRGDNHYSRRRPELLARGDKNGANTKPSHHKRVRDTCGRFSTANSTK